MGYVLVLFPLQEALVQEIFWTRIKLCGANQPMCMNSYVSGPGEGVIFLRKWMVIFLCSCFIVADDSPDRVHTVLSVRF